MAPRTRPQAADALEAEIFAAISNPGQFAAHEEGESIAQWQARAVRQAIPAAGEDALREAGRLRKEVASLNTEVRKLKRRGSPGSVLSLHSVREVAKMLGGCSPMHVYRLIAAGELRAVDIATPGAGRPKTRIRSDDLDEFITRNERVIGKETGDA